MFTRKSSMKRAIRAPIWHRGIDQAHRRGLVGYALDTPLVLFCTQMEIDIALTRIF